MRADSTGAAVMMAQTLIQLANAGNGGSWSLVGMNTTSGGGREEVSLRFRSSHPLRQNLADNMYTETDEVTVYVRSMCREIHEDL